MVSQDSPVRTATNRELRAALAEELRRLPVKYRLPVILCRVEGNSRSLAAERLGWREGTVASRLAKGRELLQRRLTRRVYATSAVVLAGALDSQVAAVPAPLATGTAQAAAQFVAVAVVGAAPASTLTLTNGLLRSMFLAKLRSKAAGLVVAAAACLSVGAVLGQATAETNSFVSAGEAPAPPAPKADRRDDPLPPLVRGRLGTSRLRGVFQVVFAPDDKTMACGDPSNPRGSLPRRPLCLIEVSSGRELRQLPGTERWQRFAFSPDGKALAGISSPRLNIWSLEVLDLVTGKIVSLDERQQTDASDASFAGLAFAPDGKSLASARWQKANSNKPTQQVCIWKLAGGQSRVFAQASCTDLAFTPDGRTLVGMGNSVVAWETATGKERRRITWKDNSEVFRGALSPDGNSVAVAQDSGSVRLWDLTTGKQQFEFEGQGCAVLDIKFAPDGKTLAIADTNGKKRGADRRPLVRLLEVATGKDRAQFPTVQSVAALAFSPDGGILAAGSVDGAQMGVRALQLWDMKTGKELPIRNGHEQTVYRMLFAADGRTLTSVDVGNSIRTWDVDSGKEMAVRSWPAIGRTRLFLVNGQPATATSKDGVIHVLDAATGKELRRLDKLDKDLGSGILSPDGTKFASEGPGSQVRLWDVATGKLLATYNLGKYGPNALAFTPDSTKLIAGSLEGNVFLWDHATGKARTLPGQGYIWDLAFSSDKMTVVVVAGNSATLWNIETGKAQPVTRAQHSYLQTAAVSPDGKLVAAGDLFGKVYLWDLKTGKELCQLKGHAAGRIRSLAFAPDSKTLASSGVDTSILLWDLKQAIKD